jgi:hypothetical protein
MLSKIDAAISGSPGGVILKGFCIVSKTSIINQGYQCRYFKQYANGSKRMIGV